MPERKPHRVEKSEAATRNTMEKLDKLTHALVGMCSRDETKDESPRALRSKSFRPGAELHLADVGVVDRAVQAAEGWSVMYAPARAALVVADATTFAPDLPGGGGCGIALQVGKRARGAA